MADKIKIGFALLLIAAGVAAFYFLQQAAAWMRFLVVVIGLLLSAGVFWLSEPGKRFFGFARDSIAEARRVVWPTWKETYQTTAIVALFAITMAVFLWVVDSGLGYVVGKLMGRGD